MVMGNYIKIFWRQVIPGSPLLNVWFTLTGTLCFLQVMDFINDAVVTLGAFADAFRPAALYFSISFDMR